VLRQQFLDRAGVILVGEAVELLLDQQELRVGGRPGEAEPEEAGEEEAGGEAHGTILAAEARFRKPLFCLRRQGRTPSWGACPPPPSSPSAASSG